MRLPEIKAPCLLVAMPSLADRNFAKTVSILVEHSRDGALAFVLNRPSTLGLKHMIDVKHRPIPAELPAWFGGPVDTTTGIILHGETPHGGDSSIAEGVFLSSSHATLDLMLDEAEIRLGQKPATLETSHRHLYPYRFVVGYAGWGAGQLDEELLSGAWVLAPLDVELIFNCRWQEMWTRALQLVSPSLQQVSSHPLQYLN